MAAATVSDARVTHFHVLELHRRVDDIATIGQTGCEAVIALLTTALTRLDLASRTALALRLREALHNSIAESEGNPDALDCWHGILDAHTPNYMIDLPASGTELWERILCFAVSIEALAGGLCCVSRSFRKLILQADCWQDHDVCLQQRHFVSFRWSIVDGPGWCRCFKLLPMWRKARTVRIGCFDDCDQRARVVPALKVATTTFCPKAVLLSNSFCEHMAGEKIRLPSPRRLTAVRRKSLNDDQKGGGLLVGNGLLPVDAYGTRCFALRIERIATHERLDIGVTSHSPHSHFSGGASRRGRIMRFAEDLSGSWVIESSGLLVGSHAGVRIRDHRWDAKALRTGDVIRLLVTARGEIVLELNGVRTAAWNARIPVSGPLYPVVDLFEGEPCVQMLPPSESK